MAEIAELKQPDAECPPDAAFKPVPSLRLKPFPRAAGVALGVWKKSAGDTTLTIRLAEDAVARLGWRDGTSLRLEAAGANGQGVWLRFTPAASGEYTSLSARTHKQREAKRSLRINSVWLGDGCPRRPLGDVDWRTDDQDRLTLRLPDELTEAVLRNIEMRRIRCEREG